MAFRYDTKVVTPLGWRQIEEVGTMVDVEEASRIVFVPLSPAQRGELIVNASKYHPWLLGNRTDTKRELKQGDVVASNIWDSGFDGNCWLEGFKFGVGHGGGPVKVPNRLYLYTDRVESFAKEDEPRAQLPHEDADSKTIGSFLRGWINTSGPNATRLVTTDREALDFFLKNAPMGGYVVTGTPRYGLEKKGKPGQKPIVCHDVAFMRGNQHVGWKAKEIKTIMSPSDPYYVLDAPAALEGNLLGVFAT